MTGPSLHPNLSFKAHLDGVGHDVDIRAGLVVGASVVEDEEHILQEIIGRAVLACTPGPRASAEYSAKRI
jgi:hypothetical protein